MSAFDQLLTPAQVAEWRQQSEKTLANERYEGRGPKYLKLGGGAIRYRRQDVETWLREQERPPLRALTSARGAPRRTA